MRYIIAIAALAFAGWAFAGEPVVSDKELSVGGVALGDTQTHVIALLGAPQKQSETGEGTALHYPGLTVLVGWLEPQAPGKHRRVIQLTGTGVTACTPSGICPGMSAEQALATYGHSDSISRESGNFLEYYSKQSSCWLQLAVANGNIQSVNAVCQA